jgi:hypothetical protein
MKASTSHARTQLVFDYDDLKIEILNRQDKKSGITWLANPLLRSSNLPAQKNYRTGTYNVQRNIYRGPFNYLWNSLKEGLLVIIPSGTALKIAGGQAKSKEAL